MYFVVVMSRYKPKSGKHKGRRLPKFLSLEELDSLLKAVDDVRDKLMIELMAYSGMRVSEVANLHTSHIDYQRNCLIFKSKGDVERVVPVKRIVYTQLIQYINANHIRNSKIFNISTRRIEQIVKKYAEKAGIEKHVYPHMLRHTFGVQAHIAGMPLSVIKEVMGHSSIQTTQIYTQVDNKIMFKEYEKARF